MKKVGLISDTHSFLDEKVFEYFSEVDEIWHAGDIGNPEVAEKLAAFKPFRAVYGNIDDANIRQHYPLNLYFEIEKIRVLMTHIAGYPTKYTTRVKTLMKENPCDLFICGHSHILKVMYDHTLKHLHVNSGAAGREGFHQIRTLIRFTIEENNIKDMEIVELGKR